VAGSASPVHGVHDQSSGGGDREPARLRPAGPVGEVRVVVGIGRSEGPTLAVHHPVVVAAQQHHAAHHRRSALCVRMHVMGVAPRRRTVATREHAPTVAGFQRPPLCPRRTPVGLTTRDESSRWIELQLRYVEVAAQQLPLPRSELQRHSRRRRQRPVGRRGRSIIGCRSDGVGGPTPDLGDWQDPGSGSGFCDQRQLRHRTLRRADLDRRPTTHQLQQRLGSKLGPRRHRQARALLDVVAIAPPQPVGRRLHQLLEARPLGPDERAAEQQLVTATTSRHATTTGLGVVTSVGICVPGQVRQQDGELRERRFGGRQGEKCVLSTFQSLGVAVVDLRRDQLDPFRGDLTATQRCGQERHR